MCDKISSSNLVFEAINSDTKVVAEDDTVPKRSVIYLAKSGTLQERREKTVLKTL